MVVFAVGGSSAIARNSAPIRYPLCANTASGVSAASTQNTATIDRYGLISRVRYEAASAPMMPPRPSIAAITPICPDGTPRRWASTMTTR